MTTNHPDKQAVRDYMQNRVEQQRTAQHAPPPTVEAIRKELGWDLIRADKRPKG